MVIPTAPERRARPWLPLMARAGQVWVAPDGEAIRFNEDLTISECSQVFPHLRGCASEPSNTRRV